jgi:signal transduction histidine kinase
VRLALWIAWGALALAAVAVFVLLEGVVGLSERRADFVSAVTHELRTPLTTFRMYAEMLSLDMVPDEVRRRSYLDTLRAEADRLTHLVENVLSYARLERGSPASRVKPVKGADLLTLAADRLDSRARTAGMTLDVEADEAARGVTVLADLAAVEQILFNLVDNACKYASRGSEPRLVLGAAIDGGWFQMSVRDFGPGLSQESRARLFEPFRKSAHEAAQSAPGVGLGLALSRRLALAMRGRLRLDESGRDGACFVLDLPLGRLAS